jgi:hypothetical protein
MVVMSRLLNISPGTEAEMSYDIVSNPQNFEKPEKGRYIELTKGLFAVVDEDDHESLSGFKWYAQKGGKKWYASRRGTMKENECKTIILMHRQIACPPDGLDIDHWNGNSLDNRKGNLRQCTHAQNLANKGKSIYKRELHSKYKGVIKYKDCWQAFGFPGGQKVEFIGTYLTEEDAALAADRFAKRKWGEFAKTNFPADDGRALINLSTQKWKRLTVDQVEQIKSMIISGYRHKDIAFKFDINPSRVSLIKRQHGL